MNSPIDDGGPAFPTPVALSRKDSEGDRSIMSIDGMSLRAWFAGQIVAGFACKINPGTIELPSPEDVAAITLKHADALIAELKKGCAS